MKFIKQLVRRKAWFTLACLFLVIFPAIPFILISGLISIYAFWPTNYDGFDELKGPLTNQNKITLIAHGVADSIQSWPQPLANTLNNSDPANLSIPINWQYQARNAFSCAINGQRIGKHLAEIAAKNLGLEFVHLIGHSCGSHLIYAFCEQIKTTHPNIIIHTTYLDPVSVYALDWDFGTNHFGRCANISEAFIDTEDTIPGSNTALPYAVTYDVTQIRKSENSQTAPHVWPTVFYQKFIENYKDLELATLPLQIKENRRIIDSWQALEAN